MYTNNYCKGTKLWRNAAKNTMMEKHWWISCLAQQTIYCCHIGHELPNLPKFSTVPLKFCAIDKRSLIYKLLAVC